jgi:uncharacterized membrane protein
MKDVAQTLQSDNAALFLLIRKMTTDKVLADLQGVDGTVLCTSFAPPAPVADKWLEASERSVVSRHQEYRDWWTVFRDPVLNRLIETAYDQNLSGC